MTKLEQVIKALQLCRYDPDPGQECKFLVSCDICPYWNDEVGCREIDLFNDALELLKERQWVSVKDRLPENSRFVLVCNDDGHMMVAQYIEETAQWQYKYTNYDVDVWDDEEQGPVCWWVELPEPPKEGGSE